MRNLVRSSVLVIAFGWSMLSMAQEDGPKDHSGSRIDVDGEACPRGQVAMERTEGHCCWPGQHWLDGACFGQATDCLEGFTWNGGACELSLCKTDMVRDADGFHCCWPAQTWSDKKAVCTGKPECPAPLLRDGNVCISAATPECDGFKEDVCALCGAESPTCEKFKMLAETEENCAAARAWLTDEAKRLEPLKGDLLKTETQAVCSDL